MLVFIRILHVRGVQGGEFRLSQVVSYFPTSSLTGHYAVRASLSNEFATFFVHAENISPLNCVPIVPE